MSWVTFDSSTMFQLPNGAYRSPDAAWIPLERWEALTPEEREAFPRSAQTLWSVALSSDSKRAARRNAGVHRQWRTLVDKPKDQQVEIYRSCQERGTTCTYDLVWRTAPARVVLNLKEFSRKN